MFNTIFVPEVRDKQFYNIDDKQFYNIVFKYIVHPLHHPPTVPTPDGRIDHLPVQAQQLVRPPQPPHQKQPALDPAGVRLLVRHRRHGRALPGGRRALHLRALATGTRLRRVHRAGRAQRHVGAVGARTTRLHQAGVHEAGPQSGRLAGLRAGHGLTDPRLQSVSVPTSFAVHGRGHLDAGDVWPHDYFLHAGRHAVAVEPAAGRLRRLLLSRRRRRQCVVGFYGTRDG